MRRAAKRDETEKPIVDGLRDLGYQVIRLQQPCDLLVRHRATGELTLLEVDGITKNRKRDLAQLEFLQDWRVPLVGTPDEALKILESRFFN